MFHLANRGSGVMQTLDEETAIEEQGSPFDVAGEVVGVAAALATEPPQDTSVRGNEGGREGGEPVQEAASALRWTTGSVATGTPTSSVRRTRGMPPQHSEAGVSICSEDALGGKRRKVEESEQEKDGQEVECEHMIT